MDMALTEYSRKFNLSEEDGAGQEEGEEEQQEEEPMQETRQS